MREVILTAADANRRLDKYLMQYLNNAPRSFIYKTLRTKHIKLNGKRADGNELTSVGDHISFYLSDESLDGCMTARVIAAPSPAPDIVYEDEHILLLNKPTGVLTHSAEHGITDTLLSRALYYLQQAGAYDMSRDATFTPALCNRLDRNTSGLVVCGKTIAALQVFNRLFAERCVDKEYIAVAHGTLNGRGTLEGYLYKDKHTNTVRITPSPEKQGAVKVITEYETIKQTNRYTLLYIRPVTGRSHQIRAHLAGIGHPLAGDLKYGGKPTVYAPAQLLHCRRIALTKATELPYPAQYEWIAPPPEGLAVCIREWFNL